MARPTTPSNAYRSIFLMPREPASRIVQDEDTAGSLPLFTEATRRSRILRKHGTRVEGSAALRRRGYLVRRFPGRAHRRHEKQTLGLLWPAASSP
jgi:hypothetical protein